MGSVASTGDEWIELYNNSASDVSLDGWNLKAQDGIPDIDLTGTIPANGYFLLERGNDDPVSDISADFIYTEALGNGGEILELYDGSDVLMDTANGDGGAWPGGDNGTKATMERRDPLAEDSDAIWGTNDGVTINGIASDGSSPVIGTPKSQNSIFGETPPSPTPTEEVTPTPTEEVTPTPTEEITPTPTEEITPTPTEEVTPTPTEELTPTPTTEPSPTPTEEVTPTPTPFPGEAVTTFTNLGLTCSLQKKSFLIGGVSLRVPWLVCVRTHWWW